MLGIAHAAVVALTLAAAATAWHALKAYRVRAWSSGLVYAERRVYSQNGEDGVLSKIFETVAPPTSRTYVEFGVESGVECNTRLLRENGWTGLMMDGGHENASTNLRRERIEPENIVRLFRKHGVPEEPDLVSVDLDCFDWYVTRAILRGGYRPRVLVNEVNARADFAPPCAAVVSRAWSSRDRAAANRDGARLAAQRREALRRFNVTAAEEDGGLVPPPQGPGEQPAPYCMAPFHNDWFSGSVSAYYHLLRAFNYSIVYCERRGVNCFSVRDDVLAPFLASNYGMRGPLSDVLTDAHVYRRANYGTNLGTHQPDPWHRPWLELAPATLRLRAGERRAPRRPPKSAPGAGLAATRAGAALRAVAGAAAAKTQVAAEHSAAAARKRRKRGAGLAHEAHALDGSVHRKIKAGTHAARK